MRGTLVRPVPAPRSGHKRCVRCGIDRHNAHTRKETGLCRDCLDVVGKAEIRRIWTSPQYREGTAES